MRRGLKDGEELGVSMLRDNIQKANASIFHAAQSQPQYAGMGTTIVSGLFYDNRVAVENLEGRITAVLLTPYPPGVPLLIPGEIFNQTIVDYLKFARDFNEKFPGFETDIYRLVAEEAGGGKCYFVDCVQQD